MKILVFVDDPRKAATEGCAYLVRCAVIQIRYAYGNYDTIQLSFQVLNLFLEIIK